MNNQAVTTGAPLKACPAGYALTGVPERLLLKLNRKVDVNKATFFVGEQGNFTLVVIAPGSIDTLSFGVAKRDPNSDAADKRRGLIIAASRAVQSLLKTRRKTSKKGGRRGRKGTN